MLPDLLIEPIFTETPQYPRRLITLLIQACRPESFGAEFVRKLVDGRAKLVSPTPYFVETRLAAVFGLFPGCFRHGGNVVVLGRSSPRADDAELCEKLG